MRELVRACGGRLCRCRVRARRGVECAHAAVWNAHSFVHAGSPAGAMVAIIPSAASTCSSLPQIKVDAREYHIAAPDLTLIESFDTCRRCVDRIVASGIHVSKTAIATSTCSAVPLKVTAFDPPTQSAMSNLHSVRR
eukprot:3069253-Prymnesium_polylepis.1